MKRLYFLFLMFISIGSLCAYADTDISTIDNTLYIEGLSVANGSQATLSLKMKNSFLISGFQCKLYLPEGMTVPKDEDDFLIVNLSTSRTSSKKTDIFNAVTQSDGSIMILASSTSSKTFSGNDGEVATITVEVASTVETGNYTASLKEITLSDETGTSYDAADVSFTIKVNGALGVTISTPGFATLWLDYDATIPDGAEVYYASAYNSSTQTVKMTKIEGEVLPRETGVIVKGTAGKTYTFNDADAEGPTVTSLLVGSSIEKTFNDAGYKYYKLTYNSSGNNFGFYLDNKAGTIESSVSNRAYLKLETGSGGAGAPTRGIGIDWGDEGTTEIESVVDCDTESGTMYNLQGMPVGNDYKGIVIKNGCKMQNK